MQHLIDAWAGVEQNVIDDAISQRRRRLHAFEPQEDMLNIYCDIVSQNV